MSPGITSGEPKWPRQFDRAAVVSLLHFLACYSPSCLYYSLCLKTQNCHGAWRKGIKSLTKAEGNTLITPFPKRVL